MNKNKFFNFRPLVFMAVTFVYGILTVLATIRLNSSFIFIMPLLFVITLFIWNFIEYSKRAVTFSLIFVGIFILSVILCLARVERVNKYADIDTEHVFQIQGKIIDEKTYRDGSLKIYNLQKPILDGDRIDCNINVFSWNSDFERGDVVSFKATLSLNSDEYYLRNTKDNIALSATVKGEINFEYRNENIFELINSKIKGMLFENMGEEAPLALALITGETTFIPDDVHNNFKSSGISHIFSVSGLHIAFLVSILNVVFELFKIKRLKKAFIITLISAFYSGVCNFAASAVRAVIMSGVFLFSDSRGKKYDFLSSICFSMIIVLCLNPFEIVDLGLILSYACVLSMALFTAPFKSVCSKFFSERLASAVAVSLAVQFGVMPIICLMFGFVPIASVLLNLIVVPIISILFVVLFVSLIVGIIFPSFNWIFVIPLRISELVDGGMSAIDFDKLALLVEYSLPLVILYYIAAILASDKFNTSKLTKILAVCSTVTLTIVFSF